MLDLTGTSIEREGDRGIDFRSRDVGRRVQIGVEGDVVLVLKAVHFEGAEGFVGLDLGAAAFPFWTGLEAGGGLLQSVEQECGAPILDAVVGQSVNDLLESSLDGVHVVEDGHVEAAGFAMQTSAGSLHAAGTGVEMEVTITLVAKGGRTAVNAIFFEMVTGTVGHDAS